MVRIALGITLVLLLATCYLGYQTRTVILGLHDKVAGLTTDLANTRDELAKTQADLKTTKDTLAKTQADLDKAKTDLATTQASLDTANAQIATDKTTIDGLNKQIDDLKAALAGGNKPNSGLKIYTQTDMDAVKAQVTDAQNHIKELETVKETLTNKVKDDEGRIDDLQKIVDHYKSNILKNGLEGEVLAVNQGWNFVVLSIGDHQGAVANGEMILKRGGADIGKVRITSVEPSTSVADIIPGSLARGVRVQPGDRVIFQGN